MSDFDMKQHDTTPSLEATLTPAGNPKEGLEEAEKVWLIVRKKGGTGAPLFKSECVIVDAAAGRIRYDWEASDTEIAGEFQFEFEIEWPGGKESIPRIGYKTLGIEDDLDD
jgi:hypothetical protein